MKNLIFLGPPGAGKGTQAVRLSKRLNLPHIAMGDMLREIIKKDNNLLGEEVRKFIKKGELVPDALVIEILKLRLEKSDCKNGFILDGFPRTAAQAKALDKYLNENRPIKKVINFVTPVDVIISRLAGRLICQNCQSNYHIENIPPREKGICDRCGRRLSTRDDDKEKTVRKRLEVYNKETYPLIQYYRAQGNLEDFSGDLPLEEAQAGLVDLLK